MQIKILDDRLREYGHKGHPEYATEGAAAVDLRAMLPTRFKLAISPGEVVKIGTGVAFSLPNPGVAGILIPRSGKGSEGLALANTAGLIDSDYQGEVFIKVRNVGQVNLVIEQGERIAQLLFTPVLRFIFDEVEEFSETTERGVGGFGHSGRY